MLVFIRIGLMRLAEEASCSYEAPTISGTHIQKPLHDRELVWSYIVQCFRGHMSQRSTFQDTFGNPSTQ